MEKHTIIKDTIPVREGEELDNVKLENFLRERIEGLSDDPLQVEQFSTGSSNLTYLLKIGKWEAVLRRAPNGPLNTKAHNMEREYKVLKEVSPHFPLAPKPYLFHKDTSLLGVPFFIMERRHGVLLEKALPNPEDGTEQLFKAISHELINTLVALHDIDYKQTNLTQFTRPEGFLKRQVEGWIERYNNVKFEDNQYVETLKKWLLNHVPISPKPTIIHYDYHFNNFMFKKGDLSKLSSVFDWEMSTVGDPFTDLATAMVFWTMETDPEEHRKIRGKSITERKGFISRDEFINEYSKRSGRDISNMNYYMAFAYFKNLVIVQQIYYRWKLGYTTDERFAKLNRSADVLLEKALEYTI